MRKNSNDDRDNEQNRLEAICYFKKNEKRLLKVFRSAISDKRNTDTRISFRKQLLNEIQKNKYTKEQVRELKSYLEDRIWYLENQEKGYNNSFAKYIERIITICTTVIAVASTLLATLLTVGLNGNNLMDALYCSIFILLLFMVLLFLFDEYKVGNTGGKIYFYRECKKSLKLLKKKKKSNNTNVRGE